MGTIRLSRDAARYENSGVLGEHAIWRVIDERREFLYQPKGEITITNNYDLTRPEAGAVLGFAPLKFFVDDVTEKSMTSLPAKKFQVRN